jgi:hypothetical protein
MIRGRSHGGPSYGLDRHCVATSLRSQSRWGRSAKRWANPTSTSRVPTVAGWPAGTGRASSSSLGCLHVAPVQKLSTLPRKSGRSYAV